jgi:protocatechuate 3,4-dioxygenase beta subunit
MRGNRWIVIGLLLLVLLLGGGGAYWVVNSEPPPDTGSKKPRKERPPRTPGSRGKNRDAAAGSGGGGAKSGDAGTASSADSGSSTGDQRGRGALLVPVPPVKPKVTGTAGADADAGTDSDSDAVAAPLSVKGLVLDNGEGTPIAGARVLYAMLNADGQDAGGWEGDTTDAEGRFGPNSWKPGTTKGKRGELRVRAAGFADWIGPVNESEMTVRLEKRDGAPVPGTLRGTVLGKSGDPYEGRVQFEGSDAFDNNMGQWTETDASGGFTLAAMPPGTWRLRVGGGPRVLVVIPDASEAWASFTAGDADIAEGKARAETDRRGPVPLRREPLLRRAPAGRPAAGMGVRVRGLAAGAAVDVARAAGGDGGIRVHPRSGPGDAQPAR